MDVDCTGKFWLSAAATIQSVSTPPPSPPSAAIRTVRGPTLPCDWAMRTPSPQRGEGWGEGVRESLGESPIGPSPLTPPSPLWGEGEEAPPPSAEITPRRNRNSARSHQFG